MMYGSGSNLVDGSNENLQLRNLNAAKVSLLLVKAVLASGMSKDEMCRLDISNFHIKLNSSSDGRQTISPVQNIVCNEQQILLGVEIVSRGEKSISDVVHVKLSPMQNVGLLLYAIFSNGSSDLPLSLLTEGDESYEVDDRRGTKMRRSNGNSLFVFLLGRGQYPTSVCRLLSDMMDEKAQHFISSFEDVIEDLEQMSNNPHVYLYNQGSDFCSSNLNFGQGHYGRITELTTVLEISNRIEATCVGNGAKNGVEAVFVSGIGGCGKSFFVQYVESFLSNTGWMILKAKFKRHEHEAREIVLSLFDKLMTDLVAMQNGTNEADVEYGQAAAQAISNSLDPASLSSLAKFIPGIQKLLPGIDTRAAKLSDVEMSHWQLVFLLSKLVGAILTLERRITICFDDMQWVDKKTATLISEMLIELSSGQLEGEDRKNTLLFVGLYRGDEVTQSHPLAIELGALRRNSNVNVTEIKLPGLSKDDVTDMIMTEMHLPRRLVLGLAGIVFKKSAGHAFFVVQLLNSLSRNSIIAYSPQKQRFDWNELNIASLKTCDSVASLIVSNLSHLKPEAQTSLKILSCLGLSTQLSLAKMLDFRSSLSPPGGIESFLPELIEQGVLESLGGMVAFTHDLIQQHVYESIPIEEKQQLHLDIGVCFGRMTTLDASTRRSSIEGGVDELNLSDTSSLQGGEITIKPSTLIHIATNHINAAGPAFVTDKAQRTRFASWNLHAAKESVDDSNFQAALFYFQNGIKFISDGAWMGEATFQICRELHEGAAFSSLALGNIQEVETYANAIIQNVPFQDSLIAQELLVRSLKACEQYEQVIARGLAVLRLLNISVPSEPSPAAVIKAMHETEQITCQLTSGQIINMKKQTTPVNARKRTILKIVDAVIVACYREASPYLPLVTCAMVNYSFSNGVVEESSTAMVVYGYFQVFLGQNFTQAQRWGDIASNIMEGYQSVFTPMVLYGFLQFWFIPPREVATLLLNLLEAGMKVGDVDNAMYCLCLSMRYSFFAGEKLSLLSQSYANSLKLMSRYNRECLKITAVDSLLVDELTGLDNHPFHIFDGKIASEDVLLVQAKYQKHNSQGLEAIYTRRFVSAFWRGDYSQANEAYKQSSLLPSFKMPKIQIVYTIFYRGIIAFQLYREGKGEQWNEEGMKMLEKFELWASNCNKKIFESKLYLLEAERYAGDCNIVAAKESYELSAKTARDNGLIHEQGLAYECYGKFLTSIVEYSGANIAISSAYDCYIAWGAFAKAEKLKKEYNVTSVRDEARRSSSSSMKRELTDESEVQII